MKVKVRRMFVRIVCRKAKRAGGRLYEFPTRPTMLSQVCLCGRIEKKPLSVRVHRCDFRLLPLQRELFYAFLARFVSEDRLDAHHTKMACGRVRNRFCVRRPSSFDQTASGDGRRCLPRPPGRQSGPSAEGERQPPMRAGTSQCLASQASGRGARIQGVSSPEASGFSHGEVQRYGVALRDSHHCNKPLLSKLGIDSAIRASFYFYNKTKSEVDRFLEIIDNCLRFFKLTG